MLTSWIVWGIWEGMVKVHKGIGEGGDLNQKSYHKLPITITKVC